MLENENMIDLFDALKGKSSEQLSQLIQEETAKESPNDDLVLMALNTLEDREKEEPVKLGPKGKAAWKKYQSKVRSRRRKTVLNWKPLLQAASVVLVITLLFALLPTQANAETWWERLARWTDDFFSFFNPNTSKDYEEIYMFSTDNDGLQQVYDAVVKMGIEKPIVPMWIPETFELVLIKNDELPDQKILTAILSDGTSEMVFLIRIINNEVPFQYHKDNSEVVLYERYGTTYCIINNNQNKIVTWSIDNIECSFSIDCQDEILSDIIESIYRRRFDQ